MLRLFIDVKGSHRPDLHATAYTRSRRKRARTDRPRGPNVTPLTRRFGETSAVVREGRGSPGTTGGGSKRSRGGRLGDGGKRLVGLWSESTDRVQYSTTEKQFEVFLKIGAGGPEGGRSLGRRRKTRARDKLSVWKRTVRKVVYIRKGALLFVIAKPGGGLGQGRTRSTSAVIWDLTF